MPKEMLEQDEGATAFRVQEKRYQLHREQQLRHRRDQHVWTRTPPAF
jgi:hypothetical protein